MTIERRLTNLLHECGVSAELKGYRCIKEGVRLVLEDPTYAEQITKRLYPAIAKSLSDTPSRVERAIRHAICVAMERANYDTLVDVFGYTIKMDDGKPTNSCFIATVAEEIRLRILEEEDAQAK